MILEGLQIIGVGNMYRPRKAIMVAYEISHITVLHTIWANLANLKTPIPVAITEWYRLFRLELIQNSWWRSWFA